MATANPLGRLAKPFVVFSERFYPDPFVFAIALTAATFVMAIGLTPTTAPEALEIWGNGLTGLLAFVAQICIVLVCGHALAHTDAMRRGIETMAGWARTPAQTYALVVLVSGAASMIAGALGLVVGALLSLAAARKGRARGLRLHFPLLVASAYGGFLIWHMGYSGTAPLSVATPGHPLEERMGVLPVTATTFTAWNLGLALLTLVAIAVVCAILAPAEDELVELRERPAEPEEKSSSSPRTVGAWLDGARVLSAGLGLLLLTYLVTWFRQRGFELTLNVVNWSFLGTGLVLARSPKHYVELILDASRTLGPVVLQYPFYAGVMALLVGSDLVGVFSDGFVAIASERTLGFWAFVSGGALNFFVPSGGGQWAIQGPIFLDAADALGVSHAIIVMAVAYGDQWTNMIQPFWALPLLAIVGLDARAIMGYCFVIFLVGFVCLGGGLLVLGPG